RMDVSLIHLNRADRFGNGQYLGPDPYFDDMFAMASDKTLMSVERIVETADLTADAPHQSLLVSRLYVNGVIETPNGAHFTTCEPDYGRDEKFQKHYAVSAATDESWETFEQRFLRGDEASYHRAVATFHAEESNQ
ncbi:MAG TPA: acyl CoA--acetate/3-ketoacid CoA transferase subunit alpha, partial [Marmoricola sp.]|nr:acyl CoA--acetate/3-ketoacid CoA transferase subunit alpha [Marmoricola sp.]